MSGMASATATPVTKRDESPSLVRSLRRPPPARRRGSGTTGSNVLPDETPARSITPLRTTTTVSLSSPRFSSSSTATSTITPSRFRLPPPRSAVRHDQHHHYAEIEEKEEDQKYQNEVEQEHVTRQIETFSGESNLYSNHHHYNQVSGPTTDSERHAVHNIADADRQTSPSLLQDDDEIRSTSDVSSLKIEPTTAVGEEKNHVAHQTEPTSTTTTCENPMLSTLPPGWIELTDPTSGRLYYYNELDNTTSWDRPSEEREESMDNTSAPASVEPLNDLSENPENSPDDVLGPLEDSSSTHAQETQPSVSKPGEEALPDNSLPPGWVELVDPASGMSYYFHQVENITSWERPSAVQEYNATTTTEEDKTHDDTDFPAQDDSTIGKETQLQPTGDITLPPGWMELIDPSSGLPYYFNELENITSWDRPSSGEAEQQLEPVNNTENQEPDELVEQATVGSDEQVVAAAVTTELEERDRAKQPEQEAQLQQQEEEELEGETSEPDGGAASKGYTLPAGWIEMVDPDSGELYYYNEALNVVSWELPPQEDSAMFHKTNDEPYDNMQETADRVLDDHSADADEGAIAVDDGASPGVEEELPLGWIELIDPVSGQPYYYNEAENATSWERPGSDPVLPRDDSTIRPPPEEETAPLVNGTEFDTFPEDTVRDNVGNLEREDLHRPQDGAQKDTGLYELEPTSSSGEMVENQPEGDFVSSEANMVQVPNKSSDEKPSLPPGWIELIDPGSGRPYYFNELDNTTSWDIPGGQVLEDESESGAQIQDTVPVKEDTAEKDDALPPDHGSEREEQVSEVAGAVLPPGWVELVDEGSGSRYYFNEIANITSWEPPISESPSGMQPDVDSSDDIQHDSQKEISEDTCGDDVTAALHLPKGWVELTDPSSGLPYYVNESENLTSWDRPGTVQTNSDDAEGDLVPSEDADGGVTYGEQEVTDDSRKNAESSNLVEEYVPSTEGGAEIDKEIDSPDAEGIKMDLPPGWVELIDPDSGNPYYYNETDNVTSWEPPALILESNGNPERISGESEALESTTPSESADSAFSKSDSTNVSLPKGWVELIDPASQRPYFYNEIDDVATWDHPSESIGREIEVTPEHPEPEKVHPISVEDTTKTAGGNAQDVMEESEVVDENAAHSSDWVKVDEPALVSPVDAEYPEDLTSWEMPEKLHEMPTDTTTSLPGPDDSLKHNGGKGVLDKHSSENRDDITSPLPPGWTELVDPASGMSYYFNETDGTSSWERPMATASYPEGVSADAPEESVVAKGPRALDLPTGWETMTDPATCNMYYYNADLNLTTWTHPALEVSGEQSAPPKTRQSITSCPRVIASFGFGGLICIVRHGAERKSRIQLQKLYHLLPSHSLVLSQQTKEKIGFAGPLIRADDHLVSSYISKRVKEQGDLLWQLISVAAHSKGKLRSDIGFGPQGSPETSIVDLLLRDSRVAAQNRPDSKQTTEAPTSADLTSIEDLLVRGKREEAVEEAIGKGYFEIALLVASMCGPQTYQKVAKEYADRCLPRGSPLHTIALLFSKQLNPPTHRGSDSSQSSLWTLGRQELVTSWKRQLSSIICNRTTGWDVIVLALGDRLMELGEPIAAHVCYMVCGCPVSSPIHLDSRMTLIGCSLSPADVTLLTTTAIEAYERTEAFEWAKRRGNASAFIKGLQPFKLMYAMLLADFGYREAALQYLQVVTECIGRREVEGFHGGERRGPLALSILSGDLNALGVELSDFEHRLNYTVATSSPLREDILDETDTDISFVTAHTNIHDVTHSTKLDITHDNNASPPAKHRSNFAIPISKEDNSLHFGKSFLHTTTKTHSENSAAASKYIASNEAQVESQIRTRPEVKQTPDVPRQATTIHANQLAKGNINSSKSLSSLVTQHHQKTDEPADSVPVELKRTDKVTEPSKGTNGAGQGELLPDAAVIKGDQTPLSQPGLQTPAPKSAPANLQQSASGTTPSSEARRKGFFSFGIKDKMTKWLNPDATQADLGEKMEAYYDEKRKVWVFPGEDPDEKAKPIGPPPTQIASSPDTPTIVRNTGFAGAPANAAASDDPLARMMAPPQRTPSTLRGTRPGSLSTPQRAIASGYNGTPLDTTGQPPTFAIFQPTPKPSSNDNAKEE